MGSKQRKRTKNTRYDVLIVGAGISGISAACHLKERLPDYSFCILEARARMGGTWDLFRFPGVRTDSDVQSFSFSFKPWLSHQRTASGKEILAYLQESIDEYQLEDSIFYHCKIKKAHFDTKRGLWSVYYVNQDTKQHHCLETRFLYLGTGYYQYHSGYQPRFKNINAFKGDIIHPQHWPEGYDYKHKSIVVIGSGATAVTMIPALAKEAKKVTMLQRSPSYIMAQDNEDWIYKGLKRILPKRWAFQVIRWRNIMFQHALYQQSRVWPKQIKAFFLNEILKQLGGDKERLVDFTPHYNPWDQRVCLAPDADFFESLKSEHVVVKTAQIDSFTKTGLLLSTKEHLDADLIVSATGLNLLVFGGIQFDVDGQKIDVSKGLTYKGMMHNLLPNCMYVFGYVNASWTLRSDLNARYLCKLLAYMAKNNYQIVCPKSPKKELSYSHQFSQFQPGYIKRSLHLLPKDANKMPWQNTQHYFKDLSSIYFQPIRDKQMLFARIEKQDHFNNQEGSFSQVFAKHFKAVNSRVKHH